MQAEERGNTTGNFLVLKDRFVPIVETFCAKEMHWFGQMGSFFRRKSINASSRIVRLAQIRQLLGLCLSIPCFKISDLFFHLGLFHFPAV